MAGISFSGLASGIDSQAIVKALMDVEALPRDIIKGKQSIKQNFVTQLQSLNTAMQDLSTAAKKNTDPISLGQVKTNASSDALSISAKPGTAAVSTQLVVDKLATSHQVVTGAAATFSAGPYTVESSTGERFEVTPTSTSPADLAKAINGAGAGVTASVIKAGTNDSGDTVYRLQITSATTGSDGTFNIYAGSAQDVEDGAATNLTSTGAAVITQGADAEIRLWAGTAAEQTITSKSNTFSDLMPGVDVTVNKVSTDPVTVSVASDNDARTATAEGFVKQITSLLASITKSSTANVSSAVGEKTSLAVFSGDAMVRSLKGAVTNAVQYPIDGVSPSSIGITFDKHGALTFDKVKFAEAMAADPEKVEALFTGIAARVETVAGQYSDKYDGMITKKIEGGQTEVRSLQTQLDKWETRLETRKATLDRTYASMETLLSQLSSKSSTLNSQLSGLPSWSAE